MLTPPLRARAPSHPPRPSQRRAAAAEALDDDDDDELTGEGGNLGAAKVAVLRKWLEDNFISPVRVAAVIHCTSRRFPPFVRCAVCLGEKCRQGTVD